MLPHHPQKSLTVNSSSVSNYLQSMSSSQAQKAPLSSLFFQPQDLQVTLPFLYPQTLLQHLFFRIACHSSPKQFSCRVPKSLFGYILFSSRNHYGHRYPSEYSLHSLKLETWSEALFQKMQVLKRCGKGAQGIVNTKFRKIYHNFCFLGIGLFKSSMFYLTFVFTILVYFNSAYIH